MIGAIRARIGQVRANLRLMRTLRLVWSIAKGWTLLTILTIFTESGLYLALLYIFKRLVNEVASATPFDTTKEHRVGFYLLLVASGTIIYVLVKALSSLVTEMQATQVKEKIDEKIHACAVDLDLAFYESPAYFDTMKRAKDAGPDQPAAIVMNLVDIAKNGMTLIAIGYVIWSISWVLLPLLALFVAPTLLVRINFADRMYKWRRKQTPMERKAAYLSSLITEDGPAKEVRGYGLGNHIRGLYTAIRLTLNAERLKMTRRNTLKELLTNVLATLGLYACIGWLCFSVLRGRTSVGDITLFLVVFPQSFAILQGMSGGISALYQNNIFINNIFELFDLRATLKEPEKPLAIPAAHQRSGLENLAADGRPATTELLRFDGHPAATAPQRVDEHPSTTDPLRVDGRPAEAFAAGSLSTDEPSPNGRIPFHGLEVDNISFTYPHAKEPALQHVSLQVPAGKIIAIVGLNGAGKTTLIKLLCRLYDPVSGEIRMDGTDIRLFRSTDYRKQISAVFQDFGRFNIPAGENIRWGDVDGNRDPAEIAEAAAKSGANAYIEKWPDGYDTMMGRLFDNGREVSIGQWQKLAIARAFYSKSRFVIFDEATSALDAISEEELFLSFRERIGDRAALIISHRLSAVRHADQIYVMGDGKVQQHGTHEELIVQPGTYSRLFLKQPVGGPKRV